MGKKEGNSILVSLIVKKIDTDEKKIIMMMIMMLERHFMLVTLQPTFHL